MPLGGHAVRIPPHASLPVPSAERQIWRTSARRLDLLHLSRFGKISGGVVEGRKRTAWLAHTSTATAVVWTKFFRFKGDWCSSTKDAKTDDRVVALLLHHRALKPLEGPRQHLDSITLSPTAHQAQYRLIPPRSVRAMTSAYCPNRVPRRVSDRQHRTTRRLAADLGVCPGCHSSGRMMLRSTPSEIPST